MWTHQHKPRKTGRFIVPTVALLVFSYFGHHIYSGEFGIDSKDKLRVRAVTLQADLDKIKGERVALETKVRMLRDGTIDKDMLDEQARRALNLSTADEVTIALSKQN